MPLCRGRACPARSLPASTCLRFMLRAGHVRPLPCHNGKRQLRRGQDPSLQIGVHGCFVGNGLDRSGDVCRCCMVKYCCGVGATIGRPPTYRSNAFSGIVSCKANGRGRAMLAPTRVFRQPVSPKVTDEGQVCPAALLPGHSGRLSPHPALRATFSPRGEGFTLT